MMHSVGCKYRKLFLLYSISAYARAKYIYKVFRELCCLLNSLGTLKSLFSDFCYLRDSR